MSEASDYRNGYSMGYKGYGKPTSKRSKAYKKGYAAGRLKGAKRDKPGKRLP